MFDGPAATSLQSAEIGVIWEPSYVHRIDRGSGPGALDSRHRTRHSTATRCAFDLAPTCGPGDSVAVNGCCLTTTTIRDGDLTFDLLEETIARTNLRNLGADSPVNLERALAATGRIGGHFVQGHIDCTAQVSELCRAWRGLSAGGGIAGRLRPLRRAARARSRSTALA